MTKFMIMRGFFRLKIIIMRKWCWFLAKKFTIMSDWCLWHKPTSAISQLPVGLVGWLYSPLSYTHILIILTLVPRHTFIYLYINCYTYTYQPASCCSPILVMVAFQSGVILEVEETIKVEGVQQFWCYSVTYTQVKRTSEWVMGRRAKPKMTHARLRKGWLAQAIVLSLKILAYVTLN